MTGISAAGMHFSPRRIVAIAHVRILRVLRSRIVAAAVVLSFLPWLLVDSPTLFGRLSSLAAFTLAGLTALAAGALGDDLDSGEFAVVMTHDASPLDALAGEAAAALALTFVLVAMQLPIALWGVVSVPLFPLLLCIAWLAALLAGWLSLMLLLATFLEGKANALAMAALFVIIPVSLAPGIIDRLPATPAAIVRTSLQLLPQASHGTAMFRATLNRSSPPTLAPIVLIVSPFLYFALASLRLYRLEPAGRLTQ